MVAVDFAAWVKVTPPESATSLKAWYERGPAQRRRLNLGGVPRPEGRRRPVTTNRDARRSRGPNQETPSRIMSTSPRNNR